MLGREAKRALRMEAFLETSVTSEIEIDKVLQQLRVESRKYLPELDKKVLLFHVHNLWRSTYPQFYKILKRRFSNKNLELKAHEGMNRFILGIILVIYECLDFGHRLEFQRLLKPWISRIESVGKHKKKMTFFQKSIWKSEVNFNRKIYIGPTMNIFYTCVKFWLFYLERWQNSPISWLEVQHLLLSPENNEYSLRTGSKLTKENEVEEEVIEFKSTSLSQSNKIDEIKKNMRKQLEEEYNTKRDALFKLMKDNLKQNVVAIVQGQYPFVHDIDQQLNYAYEETREEFFQNDLIGSYEIF